MRHTWATLAILTLTGAMAAVWAQSTSLVIQVVPEAHITPSSVPLSFNVRNSGEVVVSEPVPVIAWVRALPGQQIRLTAQIGSLTGPDGILPVSTVSWTGTTGRATGGGTAASCTSGSFTAGSAQPLISGWNQSGIVTCNLSFSLTTDPAWSTGSYSGQVTLQISAQ